MAKDINIHLKTTGAERTKEQLDQTARSAGKIGDETQQMGAKGSRGADWLMSGLGRLAGGLGFAALATAAASAAVKVAKFFDDLKARSDEAVRRLADIRKGFADIFEARGAFAESARAEITLETETLLQKASASQQLGLSVINAYTRQFADLVKAGRITQEEYQQGLEEMLGYAERHGGEATPELIALMRGWQMVTPQQQGAFRRIISAAAQQTGLTDAEVISALGRAQPTVQAMRWTPQQAVEAIGVLAAGETGRKRAALPATTLQALMAPQVSNIEKLLTAEAEARGPVTKQMEGEIKQQAEELGRDPRRLLAELGRRRREMEQKAFTRLLIDIYGAEPAAGVAKLLARPSDRLRAALERAASAEGAEAERQEETLSRQTQERRDAKAKAAAEKEKLDITLKEQYAEDVREIGAAAQKTLQRRQYWRQTAYEVFSFEQAEKERAAYERWKATLTEEEQKRLESQFRPKIPSWYPSPIIPAEQIWSRMTWQERYEALTGGERIPARLRERLSPKPATEIAPAEQKAPSPELPAETPPGPVAAEIPEPELPTETAPAPTRRVAAEIPEPELPTETATTPARRVAAEIPEPELPTETAPALARQVAEIQEPELPTETAPVPARPVAAETPSPEFPIETPPGPAGPAAAEIFVPEAPSQAVHVTHVYDNSLHFHPWVGPDDDRGERFTQVG